MLKGNFDSGLLPSPNDNDTHVLFVSDIDSSESTFLFDVNILLHNTFSVHANNSPTKYTIPFKFQFKNDSNVKKHTIINGDSRNAIYAIFDMLTCSGILVILYLEICY